MEILDVGYLNDLVIKSQQGSSNAFAELYAATCRTQYARACKDLGDPQLAKEALQESYTRALKGISRLQSPELFIAWLNQTRFRVCYEIIHLQERDSDGHIYSQERGDIFKLLEEEEIEVDRKRFSLRQVMNLPLVESQVVLMKYFRRMRTDEIADMMNMSRREVRHYLRFAKKHLQKMLFE